jgi:hypothetical protein
MLQEGSADQRVMDLSARHEMDCREGPVSRFAKAWHVDLCQVNVHDMNSADPPDLPAVNYRQIELRGQPAVNTTLCRSSVNKSSNTSNSRNGYLDSVLRVEVRVEPDIDQECRTPSA